ncbi:uncharacterized protein LOC144876067 [Branchiostoma floridae x Branchiostoma japonicum]
MAKNANEALVVAVDHGSLEGVKAALKAGAEVDFYQPEDVRLPPCTPLFIACDKGPVDIARLLLRKGASLVKRGVGGLSPLHSAADAGRTDIVELLVQHGATLDVRDAFKNTPLMTACANNHVNTVRRLIELGARPDLTDGSKAQRLGIPDGNFDRCDESIKLIQEAIESKLLRCCNPKCGKPGYRKTLKLCAQCKLTRYCSRDCQIQHWSVGHKKCCGHDEYSADATDLALTVGWFRRLKRTIER